MYGWSGGTLVALTPTDLYSDNLLITSPYTGSEASVMLAVVVSDYPVTDIYLDGESIEVRCSLHNIS